jgi:hypothetical protein
MPVRFRPAPTATDGDGPWLLAETRNIGIGGAFIASPAIQPIGMTLILELTLPTSDQVFTLPAIVRWVDGIVGMGVQFVGVDVDILLELNDYFSSLASF